MKKILFVSIDPADTSRRLLNQISAALEQGFSVEVITTPNKSVTTLKKHKSVTVNYINQRFKSGVGNFLEFNFKLFLKLIVRNYDILFCRGLWSFPGILPIKLIKHFTIIYDAHEYFAGILHFKQHPFKRFIWLTVEKVAFRSFDTLITVSEPIAEKYKKEYPKTQHIYVIRNLPTKIDLQKIKQIPFPQKKEKTVVYSGYLLPGRLLQNIINSFSYITDNTVKLLIIGEGILLNELRQLTKELKLENKVTFKPMVANNEIVPLLSNADVGFSLLKDNCLNHSFALPNKFFEYIAAGVPVLASNTFTQKTYIDKYKVGKYIDPNDPKVIAKAIMEMLADEKKYTFWQENCTTASLELNWEKESLKLKKIYALFN